MACSSLERIMQTCYKAFVSERCWSSREWRGAQGENTPGSNPPGDLRHVVGVTLAEGLPKLFFYMCLEILNKQRVLEKK